MLYTFLSQQRGREVTIFEPYTIIPAGIAPVKLIALFEEEIWKFETHR